MLLCEYGALCGCWESVVVCVVVVDTLLGPQGPSMVCALLWVWVVVGCWVPLILLACTHVCVGGVAGLFFENFTVDASIFVSSF